MDVKEIIYLISAILGIVAFFALTENEKQKGCFFVALIILAFGVGYWYQNNNNESKNDYAKFNEHIAEVIESTTVKSFQHLPILPSDKGERIFVFYNIEEQHCFAFPILKFYTNNIFVLDMIVEDGQEERFYGTWEKVVNQYFLSFSKAPGFSGLSENLSVRDGKLIFPIEAKYINLGSCPLEKSISISKERFLKHPFIKNYDTEN